MDSSARPDVRQLLGYLAQAGYPGIETQEPAAVRASMRASRHQVDLPVGELASVTELSLPGPGGPLAARLYDARDSRPAGPVVLWFHGGGFVTGDLDTHAAVAAEAARRLDLPVLLVDYRLAPEAPFPAAPDDAEAAARWVASNPPALGRAVDSLVLAGDSAGGTLAIVTAMALRDAPAAVPVAAHLAIYPATDETRDFASKAEFAEGYLLTAAGMRWYRSHYRPVPTDPRASPLLGRLDGLPPAVVVTAGLDPQRDAGRAYAAALVSAGVPTVFQEAQGSVHAFVLLRRVLPSAQHDLHRALDALKSFL